MTDPSSQPAATPANTPILARVGQPHVSRRIEDWLAIAGILQAGLYGTLEALASVGWTLGNCSTKTGIPWVTLAILFVCVMPKTLGRMTAGNVWNALAAIVGRKAP